MTYQGVLLVARQEFRTRLRTGRWKVLLGVWFGVLALFSVLLRLALETADEDDTGTIMFGTLLLFVLVADPARGARADRAVDQRRP